MEKVETQRVLSVFVSGPRACGKTHAVQNIIPALENAGFDVVPVLGRDTHESIRARIKGKKHPALVWDEIDPSDIRHLLRAGMPA